MHRFVAVGVAATALSGCVVTSTDYYGPPPPIATDGTLTVDWTINGVKDPSQCVQSQSVVIQITVTTTGGAFAGTFQQRCEVFATSITLAQGSYVAQAELLDPAGQPRTTSVSIAPFTIFANDELIIPVDFPAPSFF